MDDDDDEEEGRHDLREGERERESWTIVWCLNPEMLEIANVWLMMRDVHTPAFDVRFYFTFFSLVVVVVWIVELW